METPHLRPRQEYIDRYDRITVERCRFVENATTAQSLEKYFKPETDKEALENAAITFTKLHLWFVAGEMYSKKYDTIAGWMKADEELDKFYERTEAPKGICCLMCGRDMFVTLKHLQTNLDADPQVLFMYDCTLNHLPRRMFFNNGKEWIPEKPRCTKCNTVVDQVSEDTEKMWKTTSTCPSCGNVEVSEIERTLFKEEHDPDYDNDRARFCDEKEGEGYVEWMRTAKEIGEILDKTKEKEENKELYDAVANIRRLKIIQVEELLAPVLEKKDFVRLQFKDPEITRDVVVPFTTHDIQDGREDRASCHDLQKLIKKTLEDTNWRLMSDGVTYRLGMLEGRLKAYEKEEDLIKLVSKK